MRCSSLTFLFLLLAMPATCFSWPAQVISVADGDSITVFYQGQHKEIRLYGIGCPEKGQDQGEQAKALTSALVSGRTVEVEQKDIDRYGRVVVSTKTTHNLVIKVGI